MVFAVPYSGHNGLIQQPAKSAARRQDGLHSDKRLLNNWATAIRLSVQFMIERSQNPKSYNRILCEYADNIKNKIFGTEIKQIELKRMIDVLIQ